MIVEDPELPDEADESPDGNADRRDDQDDDGQAVRPGNAEAETRNREEYYTDLRTAVSTEESTTVQRITAEEKAAAKKWRQADRRVPLDVVGVPAQVACQEDPVRRSDQIATTIPKPTPELKQHATKSLNGNERRSRQRCVQ